MKNVLKRLGGVLLALCMVVSLAPQISFAADASVTVDFTTAEVGGSSPYSVSGITGTGFTVVADESTAHTSSQTRLYKNKGLQIESESSTVYFSPSSTPAEAPKAQFTVMIDMGENAEAGLYDVAFTGVKWYAASNLYIYANGRYIGDYEAAYVPENTYDTTIYVGDEKVYKSVYLAPDENNQVKFMFAVAKRGYNTSKDAENESYIDINKTYSTGRIFLNKLVITPSTEPETAEEIKLNIGREKMYFADNKVPSADDAKLKIIEKYEIVKDKSASYIARCANTYVQIQTRARAFSRWPESDSVNNMYTIKTTVPKAGYYRVSMRGLRIYAGSQFAIYANGEYVGDYSCWSGVTSGDTLVLDDQADVLNTVYLPRGDVEISFRSRKAYYDTPNLYPYEITLTPADKPSVSSVEVKYVDPTNGETDITPELLESFTVGTTAELAAHAKMNDGTYRSFGYTDAGAVPTEDIISVTSSNPKVVEVSDVVCVEKTVNTTVDNLGKTLTEEALAQVIDPTTTTFTLTAKNSGTADVTVTALVDGQPKIETVTVNVPFADGAEAGPTNVSYIVRAKDEAFNDAVSVAGYTTGEIGSAKLDSGITAKAEETYTVSGEEYKFAYWANGNGTFVSELPSYSFNAKSNFTLEAVYDKVEAASASKLVEFWNGNGVLYETITADGDYPVLPTSTPKLAGAAFSMWTLDGKTKFDETAKLTAAVTRAVAKYTDSTEAYTVKLDTDGDGVYETEKTGVKYEDTVTATAATEENFSYWEYDGRIVSYSPTVTFLAWNDISLRAVYDGEKTALPTVILDTRSDGAHFLAYIVPDGYTPIDAGIVFSENGSPSVGSFDSKASVETVSTMGQFTAEPGDESHTNALGYVIFMDGADNIRVIYAD